MNTTHETIQLDGPLRPEVPLTSRRHQPGDTVIPVGGSRIGGGNFTVIAGPCAVEDHASLDRTARELRSCGITLLRGGAFKPRTSPYEFQGLGCQGLELLQEMKTRHGMGIVTELTGTRYLKEVGRIADIVQIGSRNGLNYELLQAAADIGKPILLKRSMAASFREWLGAAEYLMAYGCRNVILCERGIKTFEDATRNTLDIGSIALAKRETHLPVLVDPSHAAGQRELVLPLALAGIAAGADGVILESHCSPQTALCDAKQQIATADMPALLQQFQSLARCLGRTV